MSATLTLNCINSLPQQDNAGYTHDSDIRAVKRQKRVLFDFEPQNLQKDHTSGTSVSSPRHHNIDQDDEEQEKSVCEHLSDCNSGEYDIDILVSDMIMSMLEDLQEVIDQNVGTLW